MSVSLIVVAAFNLFLGFLVLSKDKRNQVNIIYILLVICLATWALTILMSWIELGVKHIDFWSNATFWGPSLLTGLLLYFAIIFPEDRKIHLKTLIIILIPAFILIVLALLKLINTKTYNPWTIERGFGIYVFNIYFVSCILLTFIKLYKTYKRSSGITRKQVGLFFLGLVIAVIFGALFNLFLPLVIGNAQLTFIGPSLSGTIFAVFIAYAITKHHLMNIRVIATELLVGMVGIILLIDLLTSKGLSTMALKAGILIAFGYLSYLLIKSVYWEIQRRQEIEKIDKAKSEFISIASHQLRTPLTAVKGYISMILEGTYGQLAEKQTRPLENVYQSNERLLKLVNDLLNLSRLDAGKIEFSPELTSLEEMVFGIVEELRINAEKKGLYMKMIKPPESLPKIMADQDKLRQVILNIVDNAIKYTKEGGITFELKKLDEQEEIKVSDTGEGMDEGELNSLFQMFSRATAGTQLHAEGAGLGLYVARQFIEMHGGKIWAESPGKGKGSTFIIQLPIKLDLKLIKEKTKIITKAPDDIF